MIKVHENINRSNLNDLQIMRVFVEDEFIDAMITHIQSHLTTALALLYHLTRQPWNVCINH